TNTSATGTGTINDDDGVPSISIADASMEEGSTLTFNATLTGSAAIAYDVDLALSESNPASATAGTDYTNAMTVTVVGGANDGDTLTLNGSTVTVPADATGLTIAVDTTDDAVYEGDETFSISGQTGSMTTAATATGTITDDGTGPDGNDPGTDLDNDIPTLTVSSPSVTEGGQMEFSISLSNPSTETVSVSVATVDTGSATDTTDYTPNLEYFNSVSGQWEAVTGDLSFTPGETSIQVRSATVSDSIAEANEIFDLTATVTTGTTTNTSATGTGTINDNDNIPNAINSSASTLEDTTLTFSASNFGFSDADAGDSLQMIRIESLPTDGTLLFNGVAITAANLATFNAGSNVIDSADIGQLTFEPALHESGFDDYNSAGEGDQLNSYDSITFSVSDGNNWSAAPATLSIDVTPDADAPNLSVNGAQADNGDNLVDLAFVPESVGLTTTVYTNVGQNNALIDSVDLEGISDALSGGTTQVSTQPYREGGDDTDNIAVDSIEVTTGVIYLEAGTTLSFNGFSDDAFLIEIGGDTILKTTGDAYGAYDTSTTGTDTIGGGAVTTYGDFTASTTGYYTFEMYIYNHSGPGDLSVNVSVNGDDSQAFDNTAVDMYPSIEVVDAAEGSHSDLVLATGTDGGYYPIELNKGYENTQIKLTAIDSTLVDTDGSEVLGSVVISSIPEGSTLTDGTIANSFTATAGNTDVDVTNWNLDNLSYIGHTDLFNGQSEVHTLVVTATSQEIVDGAVVDTAQTVANLDITVIEVNAIPSINAVEAAEVSEEGLTPEDTTNESVYTGTYTAVDGSGNSLGATFAAVTTVTTSNGTTLTSDGDDVTFALSNNDQTLTGTADGTDIIRIELADDGTYAVTLLGPVDHLDSTSKDSLNFDLNLQVTDGTQSASGTLNIRVEDDSPLNSGLSNTIQVPVVQSNIMLILDFSGSMKGDNLTDMKAALIDMLDEYAKAGETAVQIVSFSKTASTFADGGWVSISDARDYIIGLDDDDMSGTTNYDAALAAAETAFAETSGYLSDGKNISYFLSDGSPTRGYSIGSSDKTAWETFVTNNNIDSYAVGFSSARMSSLEPIAYNGIYSVERDAIDATVAGTSLADVLLATVDGALYSGVDSSGALFGGDGGHVLELTYGDHDPYSYDPTDPDSAPVQIIKLTEGDMVLDFSDGTFTYTSTVQSNDTVTENFIISVIDNDGDPSGNQTLTLVIEKYHTNPSSGDDRLVGTTGNDTIDGLGGNDILMGDEGDDLLIGSAGADTFEWNAGDQGSATAPASDHIQDFTVAEDKIDLSDLLDSLGMSSPGVVESYLSLTENSDSDTVLEVKDSGDVVQEIVLDNVSIDSLKTDLSVDQSATNNELLTQLIDQSKLIV
ncbi:type I secretion C-terminal target domain-containing protein, partial [Amphritea opalescens]